jgi:hypothetical protein
VLIWLCGEGSEKVSQRVTLFVMLDAGAEPIRLVISSAGEASVASAAGVMLNHVRPQVLPQVPPHVSPPTDAPLPAEAP